MKSVKLLIEMARAKVHSDAELARRIGVKPQDMLVMKNGQRPLSPETVAALCDVLQLSGEEAREWVALAVIENPKNAGRVEMLRRALFACWALGVAAPTLHTTDAQAMPSIERVSTLDKSSSYVERTHGLYIVMHRLVLMARWALRLVSTAGARVLATAPGQRHRFASVTNNG
jgi:DNA-binding Xre family transcriptional regulator